MARKYLEIFLRESREQVRSLQQGLLVLESQPDNRDLIHGLLRNAHTVKGSARMLGCDGVSSIAHAMEDCFKELETGAKSADQICINRMLQGCDAIARLSAAFAGDEPLPFDLPEFLDSFMRGELSVASLPPPPTDVGSEATVRIKVAALDRIINLAGELFVCRQRLENRLDDVRELAREAGSSPLKNELKVFEHDLEEDLQHLENLVHQSHGEALSLRMLPLNSITDDYQRNVRDLAKSVGKEVRLEIRGGQIELDRGVLENLKPVLLHVINNAVVHGIESPDQRLAVGKPAIGTIRITASHEGNRARVTIRDDGRGLDPLLIRRKAVDHGVLDASAADSLNDNEALFLVLRQGFSTADSVTDLAGRGVGLDVVSTTIERMKGNIGLSSEPGSHFEIVLQFPLTLSLIQALLVSSSGETFAIPMAHVDEVLKLREADICMKSEEEGIVLHGTFRPMFSLSTLLGLQKSPTLVKGGKLSAVVLALQGERLVCTVDSTLGDAEIVVKMFGQQLLHADYFKGATVLGDGNPVLILDVHDMFAASAGSVSAGIREFMQIKEKPLCKGSILVVDDSITSRTIEQTILAANGYQVETAESGEEALRKMEEMPFDLLISDVEMPGMGGHELARRVRSLTGNRSLPIVMVSSLSSDEDRRLALEAGAKAYMAKGEFNQGVLLSLVHDLIHSN